jgi:eukaryotic-like serine/threonine-protein kinase
MIPVDVEGLLFGVVALRDGRIAPDRFAAAARAWRTGSERSLADQLVADGTLSEDVRKEIGGVVKDVLLRLGDDTAAALTASWSGAPGEEHLRSDVNAARSLVPEDGGGSHRYAMRALHASGGMGSVWLARDTRLGREVALKKIRLDTEADQFVRARFVREARITGRLQHPGIVPVYDLYGADEGSTPFYTMRFVQGRTLAEVIGHFHERRRRGEAGAVELRELLNAFVSVVNTVAFAHANRVIHRDLKGSNIVLGDFGEVIVLDWGLAKALDAGIADALPDEARPAGQPADPDMTVAGQFLGTPAYMAPEQAAGRATELDERTDIYSLGAILYELITGQPPFTGDTVASLLAQIIDKPPRQPRAVVHEVPPALEAVCLKALEKDPSARYPTTTALADDVRRFLADEPVSVYPEPILQRAGRWARRNKALVAGGVALLLTSVIALSIGTILMGQKQAEIVAQRERAESNFALARDAVDQYFTRVSENAELRSHGFEDLRRQLLSTGRDFYVRFVDDQGDAAEFQSDLGSALIRLGNMERILAEREAAEASYGRSISIFEVLSAREPENGFYRTERGIAWANLALLQSETGQTEPAESSFTQAIAAYDATLAQNPDDRSVSALKAQALENFGTFRLERGHIDASEKAYLESVALRERLLEAEPDGIAERRAMAYGRTNLGTLYARTGRVEEAMAQFLASVPLADALAAEHPADPEYLNLIATVYGNLGGTYLLLERFDEAREVYRRHVEARQILAERHPLVLDYRIGLGSSMNNLGALEARRGEPALALPWFDRAVAAFDDALAREPQHVVGRRSLSHVHAWRARVFESLGRYLESYEAWERAIEFDDRDLPELREGRDRVARLR